MDEYDFNILDQMHEIPVGTDFHWLEFGSEPPEFTLETYGQVIDMIMDKTIDVAFEEPEKMHYVFVKLPIEWHDET